jgi:hypothetical protein
MNKKGMSLNEFGGLALAFVLCAIIIAVGGTVLVQTQSTQCASGTSWNATIQNCNAASTTIASNATGYGLTGISSMSQWLPTIAVIIAAAVVIGVIVRYFQNQD